MIAEKILVVAIDLILSAGGDAKDFNEVKDLGVITGTLNSGGGNQSFASQDIIRSRVQDRISDYYSLEDFETPRSGEFALKYKFLDKSLFALIHLDTPKNQSMVDVEVVKDLVWEFLSKEGRDSISNLDRFISIAQLGALGIEVSVNELDATANILLNSNIIATTSELVSDKTQVSATSADIAFTSQFTINQAYSEYDDGNGEEWMGFGNLGFVSENSELSVNLEYVDDLEFNNAHFNHSFDNENRFSLGDIGSSFATGYISQEKIRGFKFYNNLKFGEIENNRIVLDTESDVEIYADGILVNTFHLDEGVHDLPLKSFNYGEDIKVVVRDIFGKTKEFNYTGNNRIAGFNDKGELSYSFSVGEVINTDRDNIVGYLGYGLKDDVNISGFYQMDGESTILGGGVRRAFNNDNKLQINAAISSFDNKNGYKADLAYQYKYLKNFSGFLKFSSQDQNFGVDEISDLNNVKSSLVSSMSYSNLLHHKDSLSFNYSYSNFHNKKDYSRRKASLSYKIEPVKGLTLNSSLGYDVDTGNSISFGFTYRPRTVVSLSSTYEKIDYAETNMSSLSIYKNKTNLYGNLSDSNSTIGFDGYYDNDKFGLKSSYQKLKENDRVKYTNSLTFGVSATKNSVALTREATRQPILKVSLSQKAPEGVEFNLLGVKYYIKPGESIIVPNLQSYKEYTVFVDTVKFPMGYSATKNSYKITTGDKGVYDINIDIVKRKSLSGIIVDKNGSPLKYFEGQIIIDGIAHEFFTDENGEYFLYNANGLHGDPTVTINIVGEKIPVEKLVETESSVLRSNKIVVPKDLSYFLRK